MDPLLNASPTDDPLDPLLDFKIVSADIDFHITSNLLDLDSGLLDLDPVLNLPPEDCRELKKRPRSPRQIQYERIYRSNQKRQRENRLREWLSGEQERHRLTAVRDAVPTMPEEGYPTLAKRVCQLVFEEYAILHDTYEMRALIELSKGLEMLDWKRGVLIPGCKKSDLNELTGRRTTFVFHWERDY